MKRRKTKNAVHQTPQNIKLETAIPKQIKVWETNEKEREETQDSTMNSRPRSRQGRKRQRSANKQNSSEETHVPDTVER